MGPQFVHIQAYSVKPNKSGNSIKQVLAEAERDPEFSSHVDDAKPPVTVFGCNIPELRALHDAMVDRCKIEVKVKGKVRTRSVRKDRNTLLTAVSSFPIKTEDIDKDETGETRRFYEKWKRLNIKHLQDKFGDRLKTVIEHTDEEYPHLHAYILPDNDPGAYAVKLHPGEVAKAAKAEELMEDESVEKKQINKISNAAYKEAMSNFQNDFYLAVGVPCGLTRFGPKRARLTRKQWTQEKTDADLKAYVVEANEREAKALADKDRRLDRAEDQQEQSWADLEAGQAKLKADKAAFSDEVAATNNALNVREQTVRARERFLNKVMTGIKRATKALGDYLGIQLPKSPMRALEELENLIPQDDPIRNPEPEPEQDETPSNDM
jgi:hypothetical protein